MRHPRRIIATFCTALILGCGAVVASSPAAFAATCSGTGCDGRDPYSTGCAGSGASYYVVESTPLVKNSTGVASNSYGYVQLWWSNTCGTNWTRMVVNVSGAASGGEGVNLARNNSAGHGGWGTETTSGSPGAHLSYQIYAVGIPAESCGYLYSSTTQIYHACVAQPGF